MSNGSTIAALLEDLPGKEFVAEGLADMHAGRESIGSLLLEIAAPRLERVGLAIPPRRGVDALEPELRLYHLLGETHGLGTHSQYNAWLRRLSRFCHALEGRVQRRRASA